MKRLFLILSIALAVSGCEVFNPKIVYPQSDSKISAVLVIIEDSYIGKNPGAKADMLMMSNIVQTVTDDIVILKDGYATRRNVKEAIARACSNELAIVFFTCHGGRERAGKEYREFEADGKDEFIYLSDSSIMDNELWDIFKTSTNRIFTIFNCCHAGTMFRSSIDTQTETDFSFQSFKTAQPDTKVNLLSWSACDDDFYATTSKDGGEFVKSIHRTFNAYGNDVTYERMWVTMKYSSTLRKYQKPVVNVIGDYGKFADIPAFR